MAELSYGQKALLAFVGARTTKIDPIRIMKGMFLISEEVPNSWWDASTRYKFVPYDFGPCSFAIYSDLDMLERLRLLQSAQSPGQSWKYYSITGRGALLLQRSEGLRPDLISYMRQVRDFVDSLTFRSLLAAVYKKYPDYAANSVFQF